MRSYLLLAAIPALPVVLSAPVADNGVARVDSALAIREADATVNKVEVRQAPALPLPLTDILGTLTNLLKGITGITTGLLQAVVGLVKGLLTGISNFLPGALTTGAPLSSEGITTLSTAPPGVLASILGVLKSLIASIPLVGPLLVSCSTFPR